MRKNEKKKTLWTTSSLLHIYIPSLEWNQTEKKKPNDSIYKYSIFNHGMCAANAWIVSQLTALAGWFSFIAVFVQDQFYRSSTVSSSSLLTNKKKKNTHTTHQWLYFRRFLWPHALPPLLVHTVKSPTMITTMRSIVVSLRNSDNPMNCCAAAPLW